jgi:hypothetical protein
MKVCKSHAGLRNHYHHSGNLFCNPHPDFQTVAEESTNFELPPASSNEEGKPGESESE